MKPVIIFIFSVFFNINSVLSDEMQTILLFEAHDASPTKQWLELQRSGMSASPQDQPISGEVMDRVHRRYLKSFEKPIPEFYEHETPVKR